MHHSLHSTSENKSSDVSVITTTYYNVKLSFDTYIL